jgi:hypothetical protein
MLNSHSECVGTWTNPYPLTLASKDFNMVKGKVMQLQNPVLYENRNDPIRRAARNVATTGSEQHVASLLGLFRSVSIILEVWHRTRLRVSS